MLDQTFTEPLELRIQDQVLRFCSVADFEFSMASRTAVPPGKIEALFKLSADQLQEQEQAIKKSEVSLFAILSAAIDDPEGINRALRELDPLIFSQDHGWRDIIAALNEGDDACNPLRRVALAKYLQYLSSLQETIGHICAERQYGGEVSDQDAAKAAPDFKATVAPAHVFSEPVAEPAADKGYTRLPRNETVAITLTPGEPIDIVLAEHKCRLMATRGHVQFIDQAGRKSMLGKGRNIVGRSSDCTVRLDASLREVSRKHLLIDNQDDRTVILTDLSSMGTFVAADTDFRQASAGNVNASIN